MLMVVAVASLQRYVTTNIKSAISSVVRRKVGLCVGADCGLGQGPSNNCKLLGDALLQAHPSWHIPMLLGMCEELLSIATSDLNVLHHLTMLSCCYVCTSLHSDE